MLFNSLPFLVFAALFFPLYFTLRGRGRLLLLLSASYFFYGWWDWRFISLILLSTSVDYGIGLALGNTRDEAKRRMLLLVSICLNLGLLGTFKYLDFFAGSFISLAASLGFSVSWTTVNIVLPVGISFYTFQTMSYTIDVYRGRCAPESNPLRFAAYVTLFPQLVAGPIVRATALLPQLRQDHAFEWARVFSGLELVAWGYFLKVVLADSLALHVDPVYAHPTSFGVAGHLSAVLFFSFQIYGDFAGYSLIAIGLGRIMGYDFGANFRRPYFSATFSEFWQRWHISLSSWLRDYLYIPLGGNRHGSARTFGNLVITMFLGGLWHGAGWTYVIWGLLHGVYQVIWHFGETVAVGLAPPIRRMPVWLWRPPLIAAVFALTGLAWIFFRADSLADALHILAVICRIETGSDVVTTDKFVLVKGLFLIAVVVAVDLLTESDRVRDRFLHSPRLRMAALLMACWGIALFGTFTGSTFIYFQF
jgi:alginate O-acetyltransferase complex protein AlgI